ncbi:MAG: exodeoxyribonuclease VII small subunit [Minwuia sp.]|nr:exodeoxyribonuclease VII small subunit [Minwuia sp.]
MTDESAVPDDIAAMSFEAALAELETLVQKLESGSVDLEKSIDMYARGSLLKAHCETKLKAAEARVEKLVISPDGRPGDAVPFDAE